MHSPGHCPNIYKGICHEQKISLKFFWSVHRELVLCVLHCCRGLVDIFWRNC